MIVFIPSKGRPLTETYKLLECSGFEVFHFLEPQDINRYQVPNRVCINQNNKGITYARNFMLQFARQENIDFFVCCDDDITQFGKAVGSKAIKGQNANDLIGPLELFQRSGAALAGVNQRQFAWSEKKAVKLNNGKAAGCVFLNTQKVTWAYRENTKEDLDFTMQCLDNRQNFLFFARTFYSTPAIGSNAGGLHEDYRHKRDAKWAIEIQKAWPNYAKIIEQYGRMDVRLDYKRKALDMGLQVR